MTRFTISPELRYQIRRLRAKWLHAPTQIALALCFSLLSVLFLTGSIGRNLELKILSTFFQLRGARTAPSSVILISVDDRSYKELEASTNFPLPRKYIATALEFINSADPLLVIVDGKIPQERMIDPDADSRIEAALRAGPTTIWDGELSEKHLAPDERVPMPSDERFRKAAKMELPMTLHALENTVIYMGSSHKNLPLTQAIPLARPLVELGKFEIERPGRFDLINFYGERNSISRLSLSELINNPAQELRDRLRGKVVLLGYQSLQFGKGNLGKDEFPVPVSSAGMFGVEIHATIVGNLLDRSWITRFDFLSELTLVALVVLIMTSYAVRSATPLTLTLIFAFIAVLAAVSYICFAYFNFWIHGLGTIATAACTLVAISAIYFFRRTERYRAYLEKTFSFEREREL